jgi:hypothetical protein
VCRSDVDDAPPIALAPRSSFCKAAAASVCSCPRLKFGIVMDLSAAKLVASLLAMMLVPPISIPPLIIQLARHHFRFIDMDQQEALF